MVAIELYKYYYDMHIKTIIGYKGKFRRLNYYSNIFAHEHGAPTIPETKKVEKIIHYITELAIPYTSQSINVSLGYPILHNIHLLQTGIS